MKTFLLFTLTLYISTLTSRATDVVLLEAAQDAVVMEIEPDTTGLFKDRLIINDPSANTVKSYLLFDASELNSIKKITSLHLWLMRGFVNNRGRVFLVQGPSVNNWDESSITWNTAPLNFRLGSGFIAGRGEKIFFLGYLEPSAAGEVVILLDSYSEGALALIRALNTGERKATIALDATRGNEQINMYSRTSISDDSVAPRLKIVLD